MRKIQLDWQIRKKHKCQSKIQLQQTSVLIMQITSLIDILNAHLIDSQSVRKKSYIYLDYPTTWSGRLYQRRDPRGAKDRWPSWTLMKMMAGYCPRDLMEGVLELMDCGRGVYCGSGPAHDWLASSSSWLAASWLVKFIEKKIIHGWFLHNLVTFRIVVQ